MNEVRIPNDFSAHKDLTQYHFYTAAAGEKVDKTRLTQVGRALKRLKIRDVACCREERTVQNDNTVRYGGHVLQIRQTGHRHHYVRAKVQGNTYIRTVPWPCSTVHCASRNMSRTDS